DPDGTGRVAFSGPPLPAGEIWSYGLFDPCDPLRPLSQVTLNGPGAPPALRIVSPVLSGAPYLFLAPPAFGPARLEAFTASGQRMLDLDLGILALRPQVRVLSGTETWPPGLYFFRLIQGDATWMARVVFLHN
ncbi:MAG: hypothetical protein ABIP29_07970, partial [Candidatus Eisenbacteria bacterium]